MGPGGEVTHAACVLACQSQLPRGSQVDEGPGYARLPAAVEGEGNMVGPGRDLEAPDEFRPGFGHELEPGEIETLDVLASFDETEILVLVILQVRGLAFVLLASNEGREFEVCIGEGSDIIGESGEVVGALKGIKSAQFDSVAFETEAVVTSFDNDIRVGTGFGVGGAELPAFGPEGRRVTVFKVGITVVPADFSWSRSSCYQQGDNPREGELG